MITGYCFRKEQRKRDGWEASLHAKVIETNWGAAFPRVSGSLHFSVSEDFSVFRHDTCGKISEKIIRISLANWVGIIWWI